MNGSDFSFDELKRLIKEQLSERFPPQLHEAEEERPPGKGLIQFQKIAAAYKGFNQKEKAASLQRLGEKIKGDDLWEIVKNLATQITGNKIAPAQCPEDLISNLILLSTLADLLFSDVAGGGSTRGWFMEEYLAGVTGGKVLPPSGSPGTADIISRGKHYSLKQTKKPYIAGSVFEFLMGYGYGLYESAPSDEEGEKKEKPRLYLSAEPVGKATELDYIHFLNPGNQKQVAAYKIGGDAIKDHVLETYFEEASIPAALIGANRKKNPAKGQELPSGTPVLVPKTDLSRKPLWPDVRTAKEKVLFEIDLEKAIDIANEQSKEVFAQFNKIVEDFDSLTKAITLFYEEPQERTKDVAAQQTSVVEDSVRAFVARGCSPEETT